MEIPVAFNHRVKGQGSTLAEMMVATLVLSAAFGLLLVGQKIMRNMAEQRMRLEIQQTAQTVLYRIGRDVRNAKSIFTLTDDGRTLILKSFNTRLGFDVNTSAIFNPATEVTITYQYIVQVNPPLSFLWRMERVGGVVRLDQRLLKNMLVPVDAVNYMFTPQPDGAIAPFDTVKIVFRLKPAYWKKDPIVYETLSQLRTK